LRKYRQFVNSAPEELNVWAVLRKAPPLPFLPENVHGKEVVVLPIFYSGPISEAERLIAPLRDFGAAHGEHVGPQPYVQWQKAFDPLLTPGARNYWKSHNFTELADGALLRLESLSAEPGYGFLTLVPHGDEPQELIVPIGTIRQFTLSRAEPASPIGFSLPSG